MTTCKTCLSCILILINLSIAHTQSGNWQWAKSAGGSINDTPDDIATSPDGSLYTTGAFSSASISFGNTTLVNTSYGNWDMYLVKYDAAGNVVWAKSMGGTSHDRGVALDTDSEGNCYVAGFSSSSELVLGTITLSTTLDNRDAFIAKYSADGTLLWAKKIGSMGDDAVSSISTCPDNGLFITGRFDSPALDMDGIVLSSNGEWDIFTAKMDASGQILWAKSFGGSKLEYPNKCATDAQGNNFVTGHFSSPNVDFGVDTLFNTAGAAPFILKSDNEGNVVWIKSGVNTFSGRGYGIATDAAGSCYVTGSFSGDSIVFDDLVLMNSGNVSGDIFLVKYAADGQTVWAEKPSGSHSDVAYDVATDDNGNVYLSGTFNSTLLDFGGIILPNVLDMDAFVAKYTPDGSVVWAHAVGGNDLDEGIDLGVDGAGNCYVTGQFVSSSISFGATMLANNGSLFADIFIAKIGGTTGTTQVADNPEIKVFPNPSEGETTVRSLQPIDRITITNQEGKIVYDAQPNTLEHVFRLEKTGVYFITLITGGHTISRKIAAVR